MSRSITLITLIVVVSCMSGCVTNRTRSQKASAGADITSLKNDVKRLQTKIQIMEEEIDSFTTSQREDLRDMQTSIRKMEARTSSIKSEVLKDVDSKITSLENRRKKITNALSNRIDTVLKEVTGMLRKIGSGGGTTAGGISGRSEKGFVYTVEARDSVWSIAQKFKKEHGVTTQEILDSNNLKSDSTIRPGQKLFIPVKQ